MPKPLPIALRTHFLNLPASGLLHFRTFGLSYPIPAMNHEQKLLLPLLLAPLTIQLTVNIAGIVVTLE